LLHLTGTAPEDFVQLAGLRSLSAQIFYRLSLDSQPISRWFE
jgi:hypothetical protein